MERYGDARECWDRAASRALSDKKYRWAAVARHYIFALTAEHGSFEAGLDDVRETLNLYPIYDRRVPYLAHDYAFLLIRNRCYTPALHLLEKLAPAIRKPDERVLLYGAIARVAGAAGRQEAFRTAVEYVVQSADRYPNYAPAGFIHLAHGARAVGEWAAAAKYAAQAEHLAMARRDSSIVRDAVALRAEIAARTPPECENTLEYGLCDVVEIIDRMFSMRLRRWLAPDRRGTGANVKASNAGDQERGQL
jgi:hypothetical protein